MITKLLLFLSFLFIIVCSTLQGQNTIDSTIEKLYESIRFSEEQNPDYDQFRSLFMEDASLISVRDTSHFELTVDEFISNIRQQREKKILTSFHEYEIHRTVEKYGKIAHIFSTYEIKMTTSEGERSPRGINSFQLIKSGEGWKIVSLTWYEEDETAPLPEKYLPGS